MKAKVVAGVDILLRKPSAILGSLKVGLITNPTGVTGELVSTIDAFHRHRDMDLVALYSPEHGARGDLQDGICEQHYRDPATDLPVYSLYGEASKPTAVMLGVVEALVLDLQDVGVRFYTYISTLKYALEAAAEQDIPFIVLDRPNPIDGISMEGNIPEPDFTSVVCSYPIPIRYGMTVGELAQFINSGVGANLHVVRMEEWTRDMWFDETGLPWVQPSPNMPSLETATVYPGTCFFEGTNISEGRGTTRPFEYLGAPWIDRAKWAEELNRLELPGVRFRSCSFVPSFSKYKGERCSGVQVHVLNRDVYKPVETALHMISSAYNHWSESFEWHLAKEHEQSYYFDLLAGTDRVRRAISRGVSVNDIVESWQEGLNSFKERRDTHLLHGGR